MVTAILRYHGRPANGSSSHQTVITLRAGCGFLMSILPLSRKKFKMTGKAVGTKMETLF